MSISHLLRASSTVTGVNGHLINLSGNGHLLRDSPFNKWYTITYSAGFYGDVWVGYNSIDMTVFHNMQTDLFNTANGASWNSGFGIPIFYAGVGCGIGQDNITLTSEAYLMPVAYQFTVPAIFTGHTISAARVMLASAGALTRTDINMSPTFGVPTSTAAMRVRIEAGLQTIHNMIASNYTQISITSLNAATAAISTTKEWYNIWGYPNQTSLPNRCIPRWGTSPASWTTWDLASSAATTINANRTFWCHVCPTWDYWSFPSYQRLGCAMASGVALQIYVV